MWQQVKQKPFVWMVLYGQWKVKVMKNVFYSIMVLTVMAIITGCFTSATAYTKKTASDGTVTESHISIIGTGDKVSQIAAEGMFADGTAEDLGAGVKNASANQQSTGIADALTATSGLLGNVARLMAVSQGVPVASGTSYAPDTGFTSVTPTTLPTEVANTSTVLATKMAEAKTSGKPLVVIAGNTGCSYCERLDKVLNADTAFLARTDIVLYRETSPWATNQAGKWTGGGNFPVLRVTQWDSSGNIVCDKKVNRPQTVAEIEAALGSCSK